MELSKKSHPSRISIASEGTRRNILELHQPNISVIACKLTHRETFVSDFLFSIKIPSSVEELRVNPLIPRSD